MTNEALAERVQKGQDVKKHMEQLYNQNKGMIYNVCKKYSHIDRMTDTEDLMQQAYISLHDATLNYQTGKGADFMTYAVKCISRQIKHYLDDVGCLVRIPIHTQEKIYRYNQITSHFLGEFDRGPTEDEYLFYMDMTEKQLCSLRKTMQIDRLKSIDEPIAEDFTVGDTVIDSRADMETVEQSIDEERLSVSLWNTAAEAVKDDEELDILKFRYKEGRTLKECGERQKITAEVARKRQNKAMKKLRTNQKIREIGEAEGIAPKPIYKRTEIKTDIWDDLTDEEREYISCVM